MRTRVATVVYNIDNPVTDAMDISEAPSASNPMQRANGYDNNRTQGGWGSVPDNASPANAGWGSPNATAAGGWAV
jgi:hypothetical protein